MKSTFPIDSTVLGVRVLGFGLLGYLGYCTLDVETLCVGIFELEIFGEGSKHAHENSCGSAACDAQKDAP